MWRIHDIIVNNDKQSVKNHTFLLYEKIDNLIWQIMPDSKQQLCISWDLTSDLLKLVHSLIYYSFNQSLCCLNELFIYKIVKQLKQYIDHCSDCQINCFRWYCLYELLQSILFSSIFFHTITMNFILRLSKNKFNMLMIIMNKFIKHVIFILNKLIWNAETWTIHLLDCFVIADWSTSHVIILNCDRKFIFTIWKAIFK